MLFSELKIFIIYLGLFVFNNIPVKSGSPFCRTLYIQIIAEKTNYTSTAICNFYTNYYLEYCYKIVKTYFKFTNTKYSDTLIQNSFKILIV